MSPTTDGDHGTAHCPPRRMGAPLRGPGRPRSAPARRLTLVTALGLGVLVSPGVATAASGVTDYSQRAHWLALPSSPLRTVDVFYLYPSAYQRAGADAPIIASIDDPSMLPNSRAAYARQATAFSTVANVYAPYYRQADAMYTLSAPLAEQARIIGGIPTTDARAALAYYLTHYNRDRPFILASHSQGSNVMVNLLSGYMRTHPAAYRRMIAAYVIGFTVTRKYLAENPPLAFATGADDTGVIISYNTEAPGLTVTNPVVRRGALAINPITWTRTEARATARESLGSILYDSAGKLVKVPHYADARINTKRGVVICSTCDVATLAPGNALFPRGVFHSYDYPFYYYNLRENATARIRRFMRQGGPFGPARCGRPATPGTT